MKGAARAIPIPSTRDIRRFWQGVQRGEGCWLWTGALGSSGYGICRVGDDKYTAHRVSAVISGRTVGAHDVVLHTCDNRICVNPNHLVVGTQRDNVRDAIAKGRAGNAGARRTASLERDHEHMIAYLAYLHQYLCAVAEKAAIEQPRSFKDWKRSRYTSPVAA